MKTAIVYYPDDHKLIPGSYSQAFRDMLLSLIDEFNPRQITSSCSAEDIEADVIIFFDPHSTHWIRIQDIDKHPAIKYEFMDDPHQIEMFGRHGTTGISFQKLGAGGRIKRSFTRGINFIICPHKTTYYRYFSPYLGDYTDDMLVWFPCALDEKRFTNRKVSLSDRKLQILANGATWAFPTYRPYEFRRWAFRQPEVTFVKHYIKDQSVPSGINYPAFLGKYAGALALCEAHACPKHFEIPLAGCVSFVQEIDEFMELGFEDQKNCVVVNEKNFSERLNHFLKNIEDYQEIADAGRSLVENNYTAKHFAKYIKKHAESKLR